MLIILILVIFLILWSLLGFFSSRVEYAYYTVLKEMNGYEIREYPPHIVAQTTVLGSYRESMNIGFKIVAGYIFGGNTKKESITVTAPVVAQMVDINNQSENIAMTAPVLVISEGNLQNISFGMPRSYTLESLPIPNDSRVKIVMIPSKKYAVLRFSWYRSEQRVKRMQRKLLSALARDNVKVSDNVAYAGYNAPWTPPWMNRNEVLVEIIN